MRRFRDTQRGVLLLEVVIALGLFSVLLSVTPLYFIGQRFSEVEAQRRSQAINYAREGIEAVKSIRDNDFDTLAAGTFGLSTSTNAWTFSGSSNTENGITRAITLSTIDARRFLVESTVSWTSMAGIQKSLVFRTHISNWREPQGTMADDFVIDATNNDIDPGNNKRIIGITIENIGSSTTTVSSITSSWTNNQNISEIVINGSSVWTGNDSSGLTQDITDFELSAGSTYPITYIEFSNPQIGGDTVTLTFNLIDGSTKTVVFVPGVAPDTTAPSAVTNLSAGSITLNSALLSWTAPGDDGNTGTATSYDIRYSTSALSEGTWASATQVTGEPTPLVAGTGQSYSLTGLTASTTYYVALKTTDEVGNTSAISNIAVFSTLAANSAYLVVDTTNNTTQVGDNTHVVGVTLRNSSASTAITIATMSVSWTGAPGGTKFDEITINGSTLWTGNANSGSTQNITDFVLSPSTTYPLTRLGFTKNMTGVSITILFTMLDGSTKTVNFTVGLVPDVIAPSAVTNLSAGSITSTSALLSWTAPGDDGNTGTATSYDIRYSTSILSELTWTSATQAVGEPTPLVAGTNQTYSLTGLVPSTTYYVAIKTSDEVPNTSLISNVVSFTTSAPATQAQSLTVNTAGRVLGSGGTQVNGITLQNTSASPITITTIYTNWSGVPGNRRITGITINGSSVWTGNDNKNNTQNITDTAIPGSTTYPLTALIFNNSMSGSTLDITFTMSDASTKVITGLTF